MGIYNLFPTPILHESKIISNSLLESLQKQVRKTKSYNNEVGSTLIHTQHDQFDNPELEKILLSYICEFGYQFFGERKNWIITSIWGNIMKQGGYQHRHCHSNSFVSGILYLKLPPGSSFTRFHRREFGGDTFTFSNEGGDITEYNNMSVDLNGINEGDLVLFPSYIIHDVPINKSKSDRITVAFNAVPESLQNSGYRIGFTKI